MDRLRCLQIFSEVARGASFVKAARNLTLSKATVTKHVAWLEASMGARLLNRTTTQVALTEAGRRVLEAAGEMLARYDAMESEVRDSVNLPRGSISIGAPPVFGAHHLMKVITEFTRLYPDIEVTICLDDGRADLVAEALDLSVRILSQLQDASYVAYPLMSVPQVLVAAPSYLRRHGTPRTIDELSSHSCLIHTLKSANGIWRFGGDDPRDIRIRGPVRSNIGDALKEAVLLGAGISMHPYFTVADDVKARRLKIVLPDCSPPPLEISVVYPQRRDMPLRVRTLLEFLKEWAKVPPDWLFPPRKQGR
jgi:DNA-binding transcriptional LysR family regulator